MLSFLGTFVLLGLSHLAPPAAGLGGSEAVVEGVVQELEQHGVLPRGGGSSGGDRLAQEVRAEGRSPASAVPPTPVEGAVHAGRALVLWLLGAGGAASAVALGWRHVQRRNALDHPARLAMLGLLRQQPGLHVRALARATAQPVQRAAYHLHLLERLGLVSSQLLAGRRCYFEAGAAPRVRRALQEASALPGPAAREVLAFVAAHPGASQSEVARSLAMLPGRARWHLRRLAAQGALVEARAGKALTYRPRPPVSTEAPR